MYKNSFVKSLNAAQSTTWIIPVFDGNELGKRAGKMDNSTNGRLGQALSQQKKFKGKRGQVAHAEMMIGNMKKDLVFLGMGKADVLKETDMVMLSGILHKALDELSTPYNEAQPNNNTGDLCFLPDTAPEASYTAKPTPDKITAETMAATIADGLNQKSYSFTKYKSGPKPADKNIKFLVQKPHDAQTQYDRLRKITTSAQWAADLTNEPPNKLNPETYADILATQLPGDGVDVTVIDLPEMEKLGMKAAMAVGQGSKTPPCMVVMEYNGTGNPNSRPLALLGKGITFDAGGYSLKSSKGMEYMKMDMGGSAAVVGAMRSLALSGTNAHVVGVVGLAENMIGKNAYRVSDIIGSMSGQTIEIKNTDAEGRLVLADALTYVQRTYDPHTIVDLATLTGAAKRTFGGQYSAIFANDDTLWTKLEDAGKSSGERGWRLPLHEEFSKAMRGTVSDLVNSNGAAYAGASKAAEFLHHFIEKDQDGRDKCRWGQVDMAGVQTDSKGIANGYGVRLLHKLVTDHFQDTPRPAPKRGPQL